MAKLSERAGVGIAQEIAEPLVNTSTSITSDTTAFSRSDAGVSIVAISSPNAIIAKRVQSDYLATNKESYNLLVSPGNNVWIDAQARFPFITSATAKYGMRITVISATQVDVEFGGDGPSAGETWSSYTSWKWKLLKHRDGGTINTGEASATRSGLVSTGAQTLAGDKTFSGNVNVAGTGKGIVPVGAVIAIANSAAWSLPGANAIKDGYALCNGQAFPSGSNPAFTGTMPNLSDERFLQGSTSSGTTGGANTVTLAIANLPAHNHGMSHTHSINHDHTGSGSHAHNLDFLANVGSNWLGWLVNDNEPNRNHAVQNITRVSTASNVDLDNFTGTSGGSSISVTDNTGSGTAFDIRPKYFNVVYVMRVS
jgi:microcystin-dependent protein